METAPEGVAGRGVRRGLSYRLLDPEAAPRRAAPRRRVASRRVASRRVASR